jgi:Fe2+ transport system protein FeoA
MEFKRTDTVCSHGCPLGSACDLVRCPNCAYEFPETARSLSWLARLRRRLQRTPRPPNGTTLALDRLRPGERARLLRLTCSDAKRRNTLTVFGLVPGTELTLIQRRPGFVIRVGETELGLDREIAREIVVELTQPADAPPPPPPERADHGTSISG